jgi:hypothetical protein
MRDGDGTIMAMTHHVGHASWPSACLIIWYDTCACRAGPASSFGTGIVSGNVMHDAVNP